MSELPWLGIGGATLGWSLAGLLLYGFITRRWVVSRYEADMILERAIKAEERADKCEALSEELMRQNGQLLDDFDVQRAVMSALHNEATRGDT